MVPYLYSGKSFSNFRVLPALKSLFTDITLTLTLCNHVVGSTMLGELLKAGEDAIKKVVA